MHYDESLQRVLEHIDAHLGEVLSTETLAAVAGFSAYHFCRVFTWRVGCPPMEYVRNRRLAFAAAAFSADRRIIDVALDYGFETHSGFCKAFRRRFGCTPEVYSLHARTSPSVPPSLTKMKQYSIGGIVMEPKLINLPALQIAGYLLQTTTTDGKNTTEIPAFWADCMADGRIQKLHSEAFVKVHSEYGACFMANPETGALDYLIGVEIAEGAEITDGYHRREIPPATYAVFSTPPSDREHFAAVIQGVWQYIYNEWFPASGYEFAPGCADFERYDEHCMEDAGLVCDICIPVVKK